MLIEKERKLCWIIDIGYLADHKVFDKEEINVEIYNRLIWEFKQLWPVKRVVLLSIVVEALGTLTKSLEKCMGQREAAIKMEH